MSHLGKRRNIFKRAFKRGYVRSTPHPVTVTTRIITFLVGNPYKPSFATVTGWGVDPRDMLVPKRVMVSKQHLFFFDCGLSSAVFTARLMNPNFCYAAWVAVARKSGWKGISWTLLGPIWMSFPVMFLMLTSFLLKL